MKVSLVFPRRHYGEHSPSLGLGYLAAVLEDAGHAVEIIDLSFEKDMAVLETRLRQFLPDIVAVTCQTTFAADAFCAVQTAKKILPQALRVIGGPHVTIMPEQSMEESGADIAVIGEGEDALLAILNWRQGRSAREDIPDIVWRADDMTLRRTPARTVFRDLDSLPFPARHLFDARYSAYPEVPMISSRGCPYHCSFCQPTLKKLFGARVRMRSPENVVAEIEAIIRTYGNKIIRFHDDTFTWDAAWVKRLCAVLRERGVAVSWNCKSRIDALDTEMIEALKASGCQRIDLGVESGSERLRREILNKGIRREQIDTTLARCARARMPVLVFIMLGAPTETPGDVLDTIALLETCEFSALHISLCTPFPGTQMYDDACAHDSICASCWAEYDFYSHVSVRSEYFSSEQLLRMKTVIAQGIAAGKKLRGWGGAALALRHPRTFVGAVREYRCLQRLKKELVRQQKQVTGHGV